VLLLDSDVLIDIQRGYEPAVEWFSDLDDLPAVPGLVVMELIQGAPDAEALRTVLKLVAPLSVVWPAESDCNRALDDFKKYHLSHSLGLLDSLIASCAVGRSATLCTFNAKHYGVISDLVVKQPYLRTSKEEEAKASE